MPHGRRERADIDEKLQRARDPEEIRGLLHARRQAAAKAEAKAKANGIAVPTLANISGDSAKAAPPG